MFFFFFFLYGPSHWNPFKIPLIYPVKTTALDKASFLRVWTTGFRGSGVLGLRGFFGVCFV